MLREWFVRNSMSLVSMMATGSSKMARLLTSPWRFENTKIIFFQEGGLGEVLKQHPHHFLGPYEAQTLQPATTYSGAESRKSAKTDMKQQNN
jgi:hypothetical protein